MNWPLAAPTVNRTAKDDGSGSSQYDIIAVEKGQPGIETSLGLTSSVLEAVPQISNTLKGGVHNGGSCSAC